MMLLLSLITNVDTNHVNKEAYLPEGSSFDGYFQVFSVSFAGVEQCVFILGAANHSWQDVAAMCTWYSYVKPATRLSLRPRYNSLRLFAWSSTFSLATASSTSRDSNTVRVPRGDMHYVISCVFFEQAPNFLPTPSCRCQSGFVPAREFVPVFRNFSGFVPGEF